MKRIRQGPVLAVISAVGLLIPAGATAHITASPAELPAEGYARVELSVGHGCEASPTTSISVQMPDQVISATPQEVAGWKITTKEGELAQPVDSHGETITTGVREVTWTGGPLDPHHLQVFGLSVRLVGEPGDQVAFKTIQRCEEGRSDWIEIPEPGAEEPELPAPVVTLFAADADHSHADEGSDAEAGEESADAEEATTAGSDADDGNGPLPVIALILSMAALLTGGTALARSRK